MQATNVIDYFYHIIFQEYFKKEKNVLIFTSDQLKKKYRIDMIILVRS